MHTYANDICCYAAMYKNGDSNIFLYWMAKQNILFSDSIQEAYPTLS